MIRVIQNTLALIVSFQMAYLPFYSAAYAMGKKPKTEYHMKACGSFTAVEDIQSNEEPQVCTIDEGMLKKRYKTVGAETVLHVPKSLVDASKNSSEVVDRVLLDEVKDMAEKKFDEQFKPLLSIPEPTEADYPVPTRGRDERKMLAELKDAKEQVNGIKDNVRDLRNYLFDSSAKPIHQIRKLLSIYPDLSDQLVAAHPEYAPLICKYEVWKHRQEVLAKVVKILGPIVTAAMVIAIPVTGGIAIPALAAVMIGFGSAEIALGALQIASAAANWDDVKAGKAAVRFLHLDQELDKYLQTLQNKRNKTPEDLKEIATLKASLFSKKEIDDLKNLKKLKRKRILELVGGGFKVLMGAASIYGGAFVSQYFSGFKANSPATNVNPAGSNTGGTIPGSGGNDGTGGFAVDDGG